MDIHVCGGIEKDLVFIGWLRFYKFIKLGIHIDDGCKSAKTGMTQRPIIQWLHMLGRPLSNSGP